MKHAIFLFLLFPLLVLAQQLSVDMYFYPESRTDKAVYIGKVLIEESAFGGILIKPQLSSLPVGVHGFHIHTIPSCASTEADGHVVIAGAAGGHFDPAKTNMHAGPYGEGHLGDLPVLIVNDEQNAILPVLAPRLKTSDLHGHTLMVHMGGDNYSDIPAQNGGGGVRLACGVIE